MNLTQAQNAIERLIKPDPGPPLGELIRSLTDQELDTLIRAADGYQLTADDLATVDRLTPLFEAVIFGEDGSNGHYLNRRPAPN
jgi:hypothetical protein